MIRHTLLFLTFFLAGISSGQSQRTISVMVTNKPTLELSINNKKVDPSKFSLGPSGANLVIVNQLAKPDSASVKLLNANSANQISFSFSFGLNSKVRTLNPGVNNFQINPDGSIDGFPADQKITFPLSIIVNNKNRGPGSEFNIQPEAAAQDTSGNSNHTGQAPGQVKANRPLTKIALYDALTLIQYDSTDRQRYLSILKYYFPNPDSDSTLKQIAANALLTNNPFLDSLRKILGIAIDDTTWNKGKQDNSKTSKGGVLNLGSLAGLDVTNIANGVAQLMLKRAKQELTIAFFNRLQDFLKKNKEFQVLFPKTVDNLDHLVFEPYNYNKMLNTLRQGFLDDLSQLPFNLEGLLTLPRYQKLLKNLPEIRVAIKSISLIRNLQSQKPVKVLADFAALPEWTDDSAGVTLRNFGMAIKTANLVSQSLRNIDTTKLWVGVHQLDSLINKPAAFRTYLGLLCQQADDANIAFYTSATKSILLSQILKNQDKALFLLTTNLGKFVQLAEEVDHTVADIRTKQQSKTPPTNEDYYSYINTTINVFDFGFNIMGNLDPNLSDLTAYTKLARQANDIYRNCYEKQYQQAVTNVVTLLGEVVNLVHKSHSEKLQMVNSAFNVQLGGAKTDVAISKLGPTDSLKLDSLSKTVRTAKLDSTDKSAVAKAASVTAAINVLKNAHADQDSLSKLSSILSDLNRYALVAADLASATTPEQVSSVLDNAILPVGSSSIKKNSIFNISVQSYLGAYWMTKKPYDNLNIAWNNRFGVIAPIGVSASWGLRGKAGALGGFVSLFDLGAIVDYDLKRDTLVNPQSDSTISKDYKVKLGQIFSPGIYVVYSAGANLPLSLGFGWQYGPGLGKINTDGTTSVASPRWRCSLFLAVDIPFFTIWNKQRSK